ncbi:MAG: Stp1/IreP family PP2C-type Ser/Thr phosphatase [Candidatus Promineifilaceae bacterium]
MDERLVLRAAAGTDPGRARQINQDNVLAYVRPRNLGKPLGLLIVADGMGGHQAGEIASHLAVETIRESLSWMLEQDDDETTTPMPMPQLEGEDANEFNDAAYTAHLEKRLELAIEEANKVIYNYAQENPEEAGNLGCTVTCAIVYGDVAIIANVGDSRTYLFREGELKQITDDHSYVGQLVREGLLEPKDVFEHEQRNVITRALGNRPGVNADLASWSLEVGDRLMLCSDGVWEMIRDPEEMAQMLRSEELETAVEKLIDSANAHGGVDNIGVVVAELLQSDQSTE